MSKNYAAEIISEFEKDPTKTFAFIQYEPVNNFSCQDDFCVVQCRFSCDRIFEVLHSQNYELIPNFNRTVYPEIPSRYSKIEDEHFLFSVKKCEKTEQCNLYQGPIGE